MEKKRRKFNTPLWVSIGAIVLILLLTVADSVGDTDVSAPSPQELVNE